MKMKIERPSELFSLKGLYLTAMLAIFTFLIGFLAGWFLETYYTFRGKEVTFLGRDPKFALGAFSAVGGLIYFFWLIFQKFKNSKFEK